MKIKLQIKLLNKYIALVILFGPFAVYATTKGLSQIVTPDLQKPGELSLSYQQQDKLIGNPQQIQGEVGFTPWLEGALFKGFDPNEFIFAAEASLFQKEPNLLSLGFLNLSTIRSGLQPFLDYGYYTETNKWILGGIYANDEAELILGWAYDFNEHWRMQVDFQSGPLFIRLHSPNIHGPGLVCSKVRKRSNIIITTN